MPNLNLLVFLSTYSDKKSTNAPSMNNFRWARELDGVSVGNTSSQQLTLDANETRVIFNSGTAKTLIYIESDKSVAILINGDSAGPSVEPFVINNSVVPGMFLIHSTVDSLSLVNNSLTDPAAVFLAMVE